MAKDFDRVALVVLDGVGCGEAKDAREKYPQDRGANSLVHASKVCPIDAAALQGMGLEYVHGLRGEIAVVQSVAWENVRGAMGALAPTFAGNGSPEGHQALAGHLVQKPYLLFNETRFPDELISSIEQAAERVTNRDVVVIRHPDTDDVDGESFFRHPKIGNVHYSSRDASKPLFLPIYASSDSLVQVALHEDVMPIKMMKAICQAIRTEALSGEFQHVARVILRVWGGQPDNFRRLSQHRKDFGIDPDGPTIIDHMAEADIPVFAVGKSAEMLNSRGFDPARVMKGKDDGGRMEEVARLISDGPARGLIFANMKETDEEYGHPRKPSGYSRQVSAISRGIGGVMEKMRDRDLLIVTSDHGNDPTHVAHHNHTREDVPVLAFARGLKRGIELGIRGTYADVAATIAEVMGLEGRLREGTSFLRELVG